MFDEVEPGKPKNWGWTIGIILTICLANLTVFIVLRALLDSENEFDEPIIQGKLREDLTKFLGLFALSFCFGCWCCFCCLGQCFKWATFCFHPDAREHIAGWWSACMKQKRRVAKHVVNKQPSNKFQFGSGKSRVAPKDEDLEAAHSKSIAISRHSLQRTEVDETTSTSTDSPTELLAGPLPVEIGSLKARRRSTAWMEIHRPLKLLNSDYARGTTRPTSGIDSWRIVEAPSRRRQSIATPTGGTRAAIVGVHNIDYYEVPVSLITPTAIAIVDPSFAEDAAALAAAEIDHVQGTKQQRRRASSVDESSSPVHQNAPLIGRWHSERIDHNEK